MPDVLQRALDPRVAPGRVLLCHPHDQAADLGQYTPSRGASRVGPFMSHEVSVPSQQRIGRHDRGDLPQCPPSQLKRPHGKPPSVVIGETQAPPTQLRAQDAILFHQVRERVPLLAIQPADQDREPYLESRHVDHGAESRSQVENWPVAHSRSCNGTIRVCNQRFADGLKSTAAEIVSDLLMWRDHLTGDRRRSNHPRPKYHQTQGCRESRVVTEDGQLERLAGAWLQMVRGRSRRLALSVVLVPWLVENGLLRTAR
jgi:hypothetical protein